MNDELLAINKKIKSTEDELDRLKKQLNPNSTEYVFSSAVLVKRLLELKEQKREWEGENHQAGDTNEFVVAESLPEKVESPTPVPLPSAITPVGNVHREKLRLILSGKGIGSGTISIRVLSSVLQHLQAMTDHIAYALDHGPVQTGYIPAHILRQSDLTIKHTFPGSFGLELEAGPGEGSEDPLLAQSFRQLFDLLGSSHNPEELLDQVAPLGPRTLRLYREWISNMAEQEITFACEWDRPHGNPQRFKAAPEELNTIIQSADAIRLDKTEEVEVIGSFIGVNLRRNTFEMVEAETNHIISGKSRYDLLMKYKGLIGDVAKLRLIKCTAENLKSGKDEVLWFLSDMKPWTTG
ncbi:hypothetical protein [Ammoniphilus sp. CFH 90114]|uniref:hypothetical protein n=1 Tax=Ammoniphilus sp. CFH 90114 TaxID=2493665 RepID=UPI00100F26BB|nr:hypothetical protein [Ammoniphilus sp. CFH 90114]RXT08089.1 hypothetical protein EIZ39_11810 [Ammoniphilus sp. CFH 90114]